MLKSLTSREAEWEGSSRKWNSLKTQMQQSSLLSFSQLSIMQKVNSWHKLLIQVCQETDQNHTEFSSLFCTKFNQFFASDPLQGREGYFLKEKCHLKKCGKFSCSTSYVFLLSNSHWSYFRLDLRVLSTAHRLNDMLFNFSDNIMIYLLLYLAVTFILLINKPT